MTPPPLSRTHPGPLLLAAAAPAEARAVLAAFEADPALAEAPWVLHRVSAAIHLVVTGIGKANAAGAVARVLDPAVHGGVVSIGVAGALPVAGVVGGALRLGTIVGATESVYSDEGLEYEGGFKTCASLGFPLGPAPIDGSRIATDPGLLAWLRPMVEVAGPIATVSTCSGTDALAAQVVARTGAVAEAMEGAAAAQVAARVKLGGLPAAELRVISNTTGSRAEQRWDIGGALEVLVTVIGRMAAG